jgi:hypothetical protein
MSIQKSLQTKFADANIENNLRRNFMREDQKKALDELLETLSNVEAKYMGSGYQERSALRNQMDRAYGIFWRTLP